MIALLLAFIGYQLYRITAVCFSAGLTALTIFDIAVVWLTWREYRAKTRPVTAPPPHRRPGRWISPVDPESSIGA